MNHKIFAVNLILPVFVVIVIAVLTGCFRFKKKESIKDELFAYFVKVWKAEEQDAEPGKESFFRKFFDLFVQTYEYEKYKESANKLKYNFDKMLVLFIILCIPFLVLVLIDGKEWVLNGNEWNQIYLYTVILVPLIFAYLVNKFINLRQQQASDGVADDGICQGLRTDESRAEYEGSGSYSRIAEDRFHQ